MKKNIIVTLVTIFLLTSCNVNNQKDADTENYILKLENKIESLEVESETKDTTISELNAAIEINKEKELTKDEERFLKLFESINGTRMFTEIPDNGLSITFQLDEPLRLLPFEDAPFLTWFGEVMYNGNNYSVGTTSGNLVYTLVDRNTPNGDRDYTEWCLVTTDNQDFGYIKADQIISYNYEVKDYTVKEGFKDVDLGIHIEDVYEMFDNKVLEYYENRLSYKGLVIYKEDPDEPQNENLGIYFSCNPTSRRVVGISVSSEDFPLASGFKVGDSLIDIASYYDIKLGDELNDSNDLESYRSYELGNGYYLQFDGINGVVTRIAIRTYTTY